MNLDSFISIQDAITQTPVNVTSFGALLVAESTRLVGGTFDGPNLNTTYWNTTFTGSGSANTASGLLTVATGTTANSTSRVTSKKVARYITNTGQDYIVSVLLNTLGDANNIKRWGCFDTANGFFFEQNAGSLRLVIRKNSVDTAITSFNGKVAMVHDATQFHTYSIRWSGSRIQFLQDGKLIHTASRVNFLLADTLHLKIGFEVINSNGSTVNHSFSIANATISRLGKEVGRSLPYNLANVGETRTLKNTPGTLHKVVIGQRSTLGTASITIYDGLSTSGEKLITIDTVNNTGPFDLDMDFSVGLTYVSTNNCGDILFIFD